MLFSFCWMALAGTAQKPIIRKAQPALTSSVKPYAVIIPASAISKPGLFTIHKVGDKYFFEIPDSILHRELLLTNWLTKTPGGSPKYGGEFLNQQVISFEKGTTGKIFMRLITLVNAADSMNMISKAVSNANVDPIAMVFDLKARGKSNNSSIIDVTDLFMKDNAFSGLDVGIKKMLGLTGLMADRTFIKAMHAYPVNVEIRTTRTYGASGTPITVAGAGTPPAPMEAATQAGVVTLELSTSILLMPKIPMTPRKLDLRVGYFGDGYKVYGDDQYKEEDNSFIVRCRLEPKPEDLEKYKRGELVEPKKPIVYYVDPATPKQWRPYIIAAINDWNPAFEQAGFKNAIVGKEWPENDTTMSLEDARYKVVRYLPSETANAYGFNVHDPRSGEILQSYVGWNHNIMKLLHDWYFIQASPIDSAARSMKFSVKLMGSLIRFAVSHEIGHTLGLRHNMGSSSLTPVAKLRDKKWVEANGHTVSIMDYARFNYVAQPQDSISEKGIMPRIGIYDKWAIQWGYKYYGSPDLQQDTRQSEKLLLDSLNADKKLWFGGEGRNFDARCQTEDLGDNSMEANSYGIKNLKIVMSHLNDWTKQDNDTYTNLLDMYRQLLNQYQRYAYQVAMNVGSVCVQTKSVEQPGDVYFPVEKAKQQAAVAFLNKEVFTTQPWLMNNSILNKISNPLRLSGLAGIQNMVLNQLLSDRVLNSLCLTAQRDGSGTVYTLKELISDVKDGIFSELKTNAPIDIYRRNLQKEYITRIFAAIKEAEFSTHGLALLFGASQEEAMPVTSNTDISSLLSFSLEKLSKEIQIAIPNTKEEDSKEHLEYLVQRIKKGLAQRFVKPTK